MQRRISLIVDRIRLQREEVETTYVFFFFCVVFDLLRVILLKIDDHNLGIKLGATRTCRHLYITELKMKAFRHFLKAFVNPLCWYKGQWRQGFLNDYQKLSWLCHFVKMYCMKLFLNKVPPKTYTMNHFMSKSTKATLIENHQKMSHLNFSILASSANFWPVW